MKKHVAIALFALLSLTGCYIAPAPAPMVAAPPPPPPGYVVAPSPYYYSAPAYYAPYPYVGVTVGGRYWRH